MKNLLRGNGRLLEQSGQARPASVLQNRSREVQSAEIRKDQSILDKGRSFLQRRSAAQIADQHSGIEVRQIFQGAAGTKHQIIDHGSHGAAFEHRIAREFSIFVGAGCLYPRLDLKVLILERVRQFVGHDHALVRKRAPVRDIEFTSLRIVEPFDLFGEHVHHEGIEVESFGNEAKSLSAARVGIAFHRIFSSFICLITKARISSRERRDFFSGVRSFSPVISLIWLRTSSAAAIKSACVPALGAAGSGVTEASCARTAIPPKKTTRHKNSARNGESGCFEREAISFESMTAERSIESMTAEQSIESMTAERSIESMTAGGQWQNSRIATLAPRAGWRDQTMARGSGAGSASSALFLNRLSTSSMVLNISLVRMGLEM